MIKQIEIKNFQSHKQTKISFVAGLNVITGSSDSGKSSILRALLWVVNNKPSGDSIKNWNSSSKEDVYVELSADNFSIGKKRANGKSSYSYKSEEGDTLFYDAIKTDVPGEISEQLNLSEFNIQTQHQPYFLLNDSGGEIAKKLNDLVGLSVIDNLFKNINSSITRTDRELQRTESDIKETEESINSLSYLDDIVADIDYLSSIVKEYEELAESIFAINSSTEAYDSVEKEFKEYENFLLIEEKVNLLKEKIYEFSNLTENKNEVENFIDDYDAAENEFKTYKKFISIETNVIFLKGRIGEFSNLTIKVNEVEDSIEDYDELKTDAKMFIRQSTQLEREYKNLIKDNPVCPILKTICKDLENYGT